MTDTTTIRLSEDEFDQRYTLVPNHLNPNASWGFSDSRGCLFETYGDELEYVRRQDPRTVWTLVDGDDGDQYLVSGFHLVNRIGYLISTMPVPEGTYIEVRIPSEADDEADRGEPEECPHRDVLSGIARDHLAIPTLESRRSDALDFHEVAVWGVRDALRAAFEAGAASRAGQDPGFLADPALPAPFDSYEIHGLREFDDGNGKCCEQVPEEEAQLWGLFGHIPGEGLDGIGDFKTREHAEEVFARITGRRYTGDINPTREA